MDTVCELERSLSADSAWSGSRLQGGVERVLAVMAKAEAQTRHRVLQHEFVPLFSDDGWSMTDFREASHYAGKIGLIGLERNFYVLTDKGRDVIAKCHRKHPLAHSLPNLGS